MLVRKREGGRAEKVRGDRDRAERHLCFRPARSPPAPSPRLVPATNAEMCDRSSAVGFENNTGWTTAAVARATGKRVSSRSKFTPLCTATHRQIGLESAVPQPRG